MCLTGLPFGAEEIKMSFSQNLVALCLAVTSLAAGVLLVSCAKQWTQPNAPAAGTNQQLFAIPEDAVVELIDAAPTGGFDRLVLIFGSSVADLAAATKEIRSATSIGRRGD